MKLAFIGGGNMATAMIGGLRQAGVELESVDILEIDVQKGQELERSLGVTAHCKPGPWLSAAEVIVLAVKPQQMRAAIASVAANASNALVLSIAAGVRAHTLARWLGHTRIVRAMPNTPALIGAGVTGAVALPSVSAAERARADKVLTAIGSVVWFDDEAVLDTVTAVSGSGPAYVFFFIEALEAAAIERGLSATNARALTLGTFLGAARLAAHSTESPGVLRERVTSRGGTTAAALERLAGAGIRESVAEAVKAAEARARQLGDEFDHE